MHTYRQAGRQACIHKNAGIQRGTQAYIQTDIRQSYRKQDVYA